MKDMEDQLKKDTDQSMFYSRQTHSNDMFWLLRLVGKLEIYRAGLVTTAEEKEIEIKEVIQQIAVAKADLQVLENNLSYKPLNSHPLQRLSNEKIRMTLKV